VQVYKPEQPLWLSGDVRSAVIAKSLHAPAQLIVSRNNDVAAVFELKSKDTQTLTKK
jgi:hypothetical protein